MKTTPEEDLLQQYNIRPTAMRLLVYTYIKDLKFGFSLSQIENHFDRSERTTLYRTIKLFEEKRLVHNIQDGTGVPKYALCPKACKGEHTDMHLHFLCKTCQKTYCLTDHQIPAITLPEGFLPEDINLIVKGICDQCVHL